VNLALACNSFCCQY